MITKGENKNKFIFYIDYNPNIDMFNTEKLTIVNEYNFTYDIIQNGRLQTLSKDMLDVAKSGAYFDFRCMYTFEVTKEKINKIREGISMITREEVNEIFEGDSGKWEGDNAFKGCNIISKYIDNIIQGADHDIIYSEDVDVLIESGMTKEDFEQLRRLNWVIEDDDYLACFV